MKPNRRTIGITTLAVVLSLGPLALASAPEPDGPQTQAAKPQPKPVIPAKLDVVIQRYQGDKRVASLPYTLMVSVNGQGGSGYTRLRMGVDVPVGTTTTTREGVTTTQPSYRNIGTNIDCQAVTREDGRFDITVSVVDSAISGVGGVSRGPGDPLAFRSFSINNTLALRDGQSMQFTAATDPVTGDVIRIEVTLTTIK